MVTRIDTIVAVPGGITFTVTTDAAGCDEMFSTVIGGTTYRSSGNITCQGADDHPDESISTNPETGNHNVTVKAETSNVFSAPKSLTLVAVQKAG
jgi:hypothetical protein